MIELQQPIVRFTRRGNERFVYWSHLDVLRTVVVLTLNITSEIKMTGFTSFS